MDSTTEASAPVPGTKLSFDELLAALQAPQTLEEFGVTLDLIEGELGSLEGESPIIPQLISKLRFYALILSAQHLLIRDLRRLLEAAATV